MKKQWLSNLLSVLLLAVMLAVWIMLPWPGVLALINAAICDTRLGSRASFMRLT